MERFTVKEATEFFRSNGARCDEKLVQEWMNDTKISTSNEIGMDDFFSFDAWHIQKGTAYEEGITDKVRIVRLHVEICELKKEIAVLTKEKESLEDQLGILPF